MEGDEWLAKLRDIYSQRPEGTELAADMHGDIAVYHDGMWIDYMEES